jgi:hypothetical protein
MKQRATYGSVGSDSIDIGFRAVLLDVSHPVLGDKAAVQTSDVVGIGKIDGLIETEHTVYTRKIVITKDE